MKGKMLKARFAVLSAVLLAVLTLGWGCKKESVNIAEEKDKGPVQIEKTSDTALLLCSFGSTYELPQTTYDKLMATYRAKYPKVDIYLSFTSRTCVSRVGAKIGKYYAQPDLWLKAIAEADYKVVGVQSLHVIPGEEYLSLMNTDVKKNFMIPYPDIKVAKGGCLLEGDGTQGSENDVEETARVLYDDFCQKKLAEPNHYIVLMGHGNPDREYQHANDRYEQLEKALQEKDGGKKRIFVGTVDYGAMMFSYIRQQLAEQAQQPEANNADNGAKQMPRNGVTVHLIPLMSVAGDHAHNDMAGDLDAGQTMEEVNPYEDDHEAEFSWKLKLRKLGYTVEDANCYMIGLGDFEGIRSIWLNHLDFTQAESWNEHLGE